MMVFTEEMIERARQAHKDLRMELALGVYVAQVYSLRKAAEWAGVSWIRMAEEAKNRNIPAWDAMSVCDLREELDEIKAEFAK